MNNHFLFILIVTIFYIACSEKNGQIISNIPSDLPEINYKLNLQSDSGENLNSVTISWSETDVEVKLFDSNTSITPISNFYTFSGMTPGEFKDIIITIDNNSNIDVDNIQIFTRTIYPAQIKKVEVDALKTGEDEWNSWEPFVDGNGIWDVGEPFEDKNGIWDVGEMFIDGNEIFDEGELFDDLNDNGTWDAGEPFEDEKNGVWDEGESFDDGNGIWDEGEPFEDEKNGVWDVDEDYTHIDSTSYFWKLTWTPTLESNEDFLEYSIFRSDNPADLLSPNNCNCKIKTLSLSDSTYIDSSLEVSGNSGQDQTTFYYRIQVSTGGFTQNSFIPNYPTFSSFAPIQLTDGVSTENNGFIEITWEPISNSESEFFYHYEIWRASNKELTDQTRIAIITNPDQNTFMDRTVGNGTTWYYSLVVVDISGGKNFSNYVSGWSMP